MWCTYRGSWGWQLLWVVACLALATQYGTATRTAKAPAPSPLDVKAFTHGIDTHKFAVHCHSDSDAYATPPPHYTTPSLPPPPPRCHSSVCMVIWVEHFPHSWMDSTGYDYSEDPRNKKNISLQAPAYSPFDSVQCVVMDIASGTADSSFTTPPTTTSSSSSSGSYTNKNNRVFRMKQFLNKLFISGKSTNEVSVCRCGMQADTAERMYTTATQHHVVAFGDSTVRNFIRFYHDIIRDAATMIPVEFLFPNVYSSQAIDKDMIPTNYYRSLANSTFRGVSNNEFVAAMKKEYFSRGYSNSIGKYNILHPAVCPLGNSVTDEVNINSKSERTNSTALFSRRKNVTSVNWPGVDTSDSHVPYEQWVKASYELLRDPLIEYELEAERICALSKPTNSILFVLSAGLHYIPRPTLSSAYTFLTYEYDVARAYQDLLRGVLRVDGCLDRTTFLWKFPNMIDYHVKISALSLFPSTDLCIKQSCDDFIKFHGHNASDSDIQSFDYICRTFKFDVNASKFLVDRSEFVVDGLNRCIFGHSRLNVNFNPDNHSFSNFNWRNWSDIPWTPETASLRFIDENFLDNPQSSFLCPHDLKHDVISKKRSMLRTNSPEGNNVKASDLSRQTRNFGTRHILKFPGSKLTQFFAAAGLQTDSKHFGFPLHAIFLRSIQGITQEFMALNDYRYFRKHNIIQTCLRPQCQSHFSGTRSWNTIGIREFCEAYRHYFSHNNTVDEKRTFNRANFLVARGKH